MLTSGKRVSNAWATYLRAGDNIAKAVLIPHNIWTLMVTISKLGIFEPDT